jgi:hypothetical protein
MADFTALRIGQTNQAGDDRSLFLKLFSGEVLTAFSNNTVMKGRHRTRTIRGGKSAQFPLTGKLTATYHDPGTEIVGQNANQNERVINIDKLLVAPVFIPNIDEAMSQYDYRGIYSREAGTALAQKFDRNTIQLAILAARAAAINADHPAGSAIAVASMNSDASVFKAGLVSAAEELDEKNAPSTGRTAIVRPASYWQLFSQAVSVNVMNRDLGGAGSNASGAFSEYAGITIVKSNNIPSTNIAADADENNTYTGDFTKTVAVVFHEEAIGTVQLMAPSVGMDPFSERYQGVLVVAKYAMGHGILRPQVAVELATP